MGVWEVCGRIEHLVVFSSKMSDDGGFAILTPISIKTIAESRGIDELPEDVLDALAEDASYRVREILNISTQFMRRARRLILKSKDVTKALDISNVPATLGEQHADTSEYEYIEEGGFHVLKDEAIDLWEVALSDGSENEINVPTFNSEWVISDKGSSPSSVEQINRTEDVSPILMEYFTNIVTSILGEDNLLRKESLMDLKKNSKISPLISYFVNFSLNVKAVSHDLEQLSHLLQAVSALVTNRYLNFLGFLKPLASSVLYCVLEPLTASINPINDHWRLRDYGSRILARMVEHHGSENEEVKKFIYESVKSILADPTRPLCSHYGAIVTINAIGIPAIIELLCPSLSSYYQTSLKIVDEDTDLNNLQLKEDAFKVLGAILHSVEMLCQFVMKEDKALDANLLKFCSEMLAMFGDSLQARLPLNTPTKVSKDNQSISPAALHFSGPVLTKLPPVFRRSRLRRLEMFETSRLRNGKIRILYGHSNQLVESTKNYRHSQYFSLALKTGNIGKLKYRHQRNAVHDFLGIVL